MNKAYDELEVGMKFKAVNTIDRGFIKPGDIVELLSIDTIDSVTSFFLRNLRTDEFLTFGETEDDLNYQFCEHFTIIGK